MRWPFMACSAVCSDKNRMTFASRVVVRPPSYSSDLDQDRRCPAIVPPSFDNHRQLRLRQIPLVHELRDPTNIGPFDSPRILSSNTQKPTACRNRQRFKDRRLPASVVTDKKVELRVKLECKILEAFEILHVKTRDIHDESIANIRHAAQQRFRPQFLTDF